MARSEKGVNTYSPSVRIVSSRTTHLVQTPFSEHLRSANFLMGVTNTAPFHGAQGKSVAAQLSSVSTSLWSMDKYLLFLVTAVPNMFQEIHPFRVRCCMWVDFGTAPRVGVCGVDMFRCFGVMDVH